MDKTIAGLLGDDLDQTDEDNLTYTVSDDVLEAAACKEEEAGWRLYQMSKPDSYFYPCSVCPAPMIGPR
jgi:hypothetical protein